MTDSKKTVSFALSAVGMTALAVCSWYMTQPTKSSDYSLEGKEFFEDFQGSSAAAALEVTAIDPKTTNIQQFRVEEKDGVWTIPSHYGYPAEATDRLATTASSLIGLTRQSLVGRLAKDHEAYGVVDPDGETTVDPDAAGKRITIRDEDGEALVDLIIGKQADESKLSDTDVAFGQTKSDSFYYVRRPDEVQTYKVSLDLELSTKFSDWIRPNLLDLDGSVLRRIEVDNYELKEQADPLGRVVRLLKNQGDQLRFTRENGFGPWSLADLPDEKKLDSARLDQVVTTLENLKIVGVRKKTDYKGQPLLNADLTLNQIPELQQNPQQFQMVIAELQQELNDYGFNLTPVGQDSRELALVSNFGEMAAGTEEGVVYTLQFGNPIEGDDNEIEIGSPKSKADKDQPDGGLKQEDSANATGDQAAASDPDGKAADAGDPDPVVGDKVNSDDADTDDEPSEDIRNRFLMIRVSFDETLLGEKPAAPEAPVEPQQPEGYVPAPEKNDLQPNDADADLDQAPAPEDDDTADAAADNNGDEADSDDNATEAGDREPSDNSDETKDDRPTEFRDYDRARKEYDNNKTEFEMTLSQFEDDIKVFNDKVIAGQKRVAELNERFGAWFYVISADNLESVQLKKNDLISDKEPVTDPSGQPAGLPDRPNINLDDLMPNLPTDDEQPMSEVDQPVSGAPQSPGDEDGEVPSDPTGGQPPAATGMSDDDLDSSGDVDGGSPSPDPADDQPNQPEDDG